jgi:hypothetical protein
MAFGSGCSPDSLAANLVVASLVVANLELENAIWNSMP